MQVVQEIHQNGGTAYAAEVDALDEQAVQTYLDSVAQQAGSIDILLNVMGPQPKEYGNQTSTMELPLEQFLLPLQTLVPSQFITARAAARHMVQQHSGAIPFVTARASRGDPNVSAIGAAFGAMVGTRTIQQSLENAVKMLGVPKEQIVSILEQRTLLKRLPTVADTARLAAFLASDGAATITGAIVNASSGMVID